MPLSMLVLCLGLTSFGPELSSSLCVQVSSWVQVPCTQTRLVVTDFFFLHVMIIVVQVQLILCSHLYPVLKAQIPPIFGHISMMSIQNIQE